MLKKITFRKILLGLALLLIVFQFFRINTSNPPIDRSQDFINMVQPSADIASLVKTSCYDCHSNEVTYPWYCQVAPVSWWIKHHIDEGTEHLNFSRWGTYTKKKQNKKLSECARNIEEAEMPLTSYTLIHQQASLSKEQQDLLAKWFKSMRAANRE